MSETLSQHVAAEVRAAMARRRVSQSGLAAELGIAQSGLSRRLNGQVPFDIDELEKLSTFLEVPVGTLIPQVVPQ